MRPRRGAAAVLAMIYLVLLSGLATAMYHVSAMNSRGSAVVADALRARSLAESGLRWQAARLADADLRPRISTGQLSIDDASAVWLGWSDSAGTTVGMRERILDDWDDNLPDTAVIDDSQGSFPFGIEVSNFEVQGGKLDIRVERLPDTAYDTSAGSNSYRQFIEVSCTATVNEGTLREVSRTSSMRFSLDKRIDFAVVGKTRIQLGRNTLVDGPVAMGTANKFSPYLILSDFDHFDSWLAGRLDDWHDLLVDEEADWGNRLRTGTSAADVAIDAGFVDYDGDGWIDEFDLLLDRFDTDGDLAISQLEFTGPDGLYEPDLWEAVDSAGGPMFDGDPARSGWNDGYLDKQDLYAKVRGSISMRDSAESWQDYLDGRGKGETIRDLMRGPLIPDSPDAAPVLFGASPEDMIDLDPANFEGATDGFRSRTAENAGDTLREFDPIVNDEGKELWVKTSGDDIGDTYWADAGSYDAFGAVQGEWEAQLKSTVIENAVLSLDDADRFYDDGEVVTRRAEERTPFGSGSWQATYDRPVFENVTFRNVEIPRGLNAVFKNCTFEGVTYVDVERNITKNGSVTYDKNDGKNWAQSMKTGSFSKNDPINPSNSNGAADGNNLRFDSCTFKGPVTAAYSTAYTHFANSWEFTGETLFDNVVDETATIVAPNTNIEMGSFERPGETPSTMKGVVVAGNIDIRGTGIVDGSIIVVGDGAGNTTLGYFGSRDSDTDAGADPISGGYGRLNIRYNPYRALPDGINIHVTVEAVPHTYREN
ncbi:MAG: hypothetical protein AAF561_07035 [Planctomycetota bacterium]